MQNEPQLSAEMDKRAEEVFEHYNGDGYASPCPRTPCDCQVKEYKHFLATALEEAYRKGLNDGEINRVKVVERVRSQERAKVLSEVRELVAYSSFEMTPGGRPIERTCSVEEAMTQLEKDVAKLNQLKGNHD